MRRRYLSLGAAAATVLGLLIPVTAPTALAVLVAPCAAAGQAGTHVIAVDAGAGVFGEAPVPAGHNWEFTDYFPRGGATTFPTVKNGDCLNFKWDGGFDSFHTVSFFATTDNLATHPWTTKPLAIPDTGGSDSAEGPQVNGAAFGPSNGACGSAPGSACTITGAPGSFDSSGAAGGPAQWWTRLNVGQYTGQLWYFCLIHPSMAGYVTVTGSQGLTTTPAGEKAQAQAQYTADTAEANAAETSANSSATTTNANGTHTITATAGTGTAHTEVDEMFPGGPSGVGCPAGHTPCWRGNLTATAGDTVTWTYKGPRNIHTLTFPAGSGSNGVDPFKAPVCEGTGSNDPAAPNPGAGPPFGCGGPFESPFDPAPRGPSAIADATTVATAGVLGSSFSPFPQSHSFTFPNANAGLTYQCRIHDDMIGVVQVLAAAVAPAATPALPKAGTDMRRAVPAGNAGVVLAFAVLTLIALLPAARFAIRKRR